MPPKQIGNRGGRTVQEKGFARKAVEELTSVENRQVITAVGLFAVRLLNTSIPSCGDQKLTVMKYRSVSLSYTAALASSSCLRRGLEHWTAFYSMTEARRVVKIG
jgi:hypothetical protein